MLTCNKVAITGTISSGKSTVCRILHELGADVIDADVIVHRLLTPDTELGNKVLNLFDSDVLDNGRFDRAKIAERVFNNSSLLCALENILHPAVEKEITAEYQRAITQRHAPLFVAEVPLLFESDSQGYYDWVVVVVADEASCRQRFANKTSYPEQEYHKRAARLIPLNEKEQQADFVIVNNGSVNQLRDAVQELYPQLLKKNAKKHSV